MLLATGAAPQKPPAKVQAPRTLEEMAQLARQRARRALRSGKRVLEQILPDLSMPYEENRDFVERALRDLVRRGPDLAPILDALIESLPELAANIEANGGLKLRGYMLEQGLLVPVLDDCPVPIAYYGVARHVDHNGCV